MIEYFAAVEIQHLKDGGYIAHFSS